jgi:hypothetical protein
MASDQERSRTPDLSTLSSLLRHAPASATVSADLDHDLSSFTNDLQHGSDQNDWSLIDQHLGEWSPGFETFDSQFFAAPDVPLPLPASATPETGNGTGTWTPPTGFRATDLQQEFADITTAAHSVSDHITPGSSESPIGVSDERSKIPPKIGTRFSKESLRILRNWLSTHGKRPFPTEEERALLQHQTGLTKTQILNWLANARRRGKIPDYQASSPRVRSNATSPIGIPRRAATPVPQVGASHFDPLQRWVDSPPEHEPATAAAIARAVASSPPAGKESFNAGRSPRTMFSLTFQS